MRILLLGEFSALHKNLKDGLIALGHEVVTASTGDGWKAVECDIFFGSTLPGLANKLQRFSRLLTSINKFKGFDIVQLVQPTIYPIKPNLNYILVDYLKKHNGKLFLVGAGASSTNTYIANFYQNRFKYQDFYKILERNKGFWSQNEAGENYNDWLHEQIDGYIPIMYEYAQPYRDIKYDKLKDTIPIPCNLKNIKYHENIQNGKLLVFHGLLREEEKGTPYIREAMLNVQKRYPNDIDVVIQGNMPLNDYLELLQTTNVVIDQTYSASYGVNAVYNLAMGKVVLGGGEEECLNEFGINSSPLIPIKPEVKNIEEKLISLLDNRHNIQAQGAESRLYAERLHDCVKVAEQYIKAWTC